MICYKLDIKSFLRLRMMKLGSNDISRIQRILDPLTVTILFEILIGQDFPSTITTFPISIIVFASIITILPQSGIYKSFRQRSLYFLARRVINGWLLVIAALITITFLSKTTANFSRIDTLYWFILSTGILLCNHIGLRKLIRYYRVKGANQHNILYWGDEESAQKFAKLLRPATQDYLGNPTTQQLPSWSRVLSCENKLQEDLANAGSKGIISTKKI